MNAEDWYVIDDWFDHYWSEADELIVATFSDPEAYRRRQLYQSLARWAITPEERALMAFEVERAIIREVGKTLEFVTESMVDEG